MKRIATACIILMMTGTALPEEPFIPPVHRDQSLFWPVAGGVLVGTMGLLCGSMFGAGLGGDGLDAIPYIIGGAVIGESVGLAMGVHIGNRSQGNLGLDFLASLGLLGAVALVNMGVNQNNRNDGFLVTIPIFQLIGTVAVERHTGRNNR